MTELGNAFIGRIELELGHLAPVTVLTSQLESLGEADIPFPECLAGKPRLRKLAPRKVGGDMRIVPGEADKLFSRLIVLPA